MPPLPSTAARVWVTPGRDEDRFLPEGPRAVALFGREAVAWVNIQTAVGAESGGVFARFWDTGEVRAFPSTFRCGFLLPTDKPDAILWGADKHLSVTDLRLGVTEKLAAIPDKSERTIINDAEVTPDGRAVVFGTKDLDFADPIAALYLFTPADGQLTQLADEQTCSNGKTICPAADGTFTVYDIDTPRKVVTTYTLDVAARTLKEAGVALDLRAEPGFPDGMVDCGDGTAVVAFYDPDPVPAGRAVRYRLGTGEPVEEWRTPGSPRVTCPLLVARPDGVKLVLTTAVEGMPADHRASCPNAGCLFIADTGLASVPPVVAVRL
jgi:sugar lactone lactonase YvrE